MAIPGRREAVDLLCSFEPPRWFLAHSITVAEVAADVARRIEERGIPVDSGLVDAAALLHDIDKLFRPDDPLRRLGHGHAGARWLEQHGYGELSGPVAAHPITRLSDPEAYRRWAAFSNRESRIVAYADKRGAQHLVSLQERLSDMERRHPEYLASLREARPRAERLEREICAAARCDPAEIRRQPWVSAARRRSVVPVPEPAAL